MLKRKEDCTGKALRKRLDKMPKKKIPEFICYKCNQKFQGLDSFHGEFSIGGKDVKLCTKCLAETLALWCEEPKKIERHLLKEIENLINQHRINRFADAKRIAYEEVFDYLRNCVMFNGFNDRTSWTNGLEQTAAMTVHDELHINCEGQIRLSFPGLYNATVDGLIQINRKNVVVEYDGSGYHSTKEQKERDSYRDFHLTKYGNYIVVRIPETIIKYNKSKFKTSVLDALYGKTQRNTKALSTQTALPNSTV